MKQIETEEGKTFKQWKREVKAYAWKLRYPITIDSDPESWQSYFDSGYDRHPLT